MAEIKISDLSIGDWVEIDGEPAKALCLRIAGGHIFKGVSGQMYRCCGGMDFEPIPLTPEILEKNGFDAHGNEYYMYDDGKKHRVYISNRNKYWIFEHWEFGLGCVFNDMKCELLHIHQLQHALRLAGVEKEIEV